MGFRANPEIIIETISLRSDVLKSFIVKEDSIIVETTDMQMYDFVYTQELEDELNELFNPEVKVVIQISIKLQEGAKAPEYGSELAAGADVSAYKVEDINPKFLFNSSIDENGSLIIQPGGRALVNTGISMELPEGYEAQIRPRSGMALKHGITVLNSPGTIDADYRGSVGVIVINQGFEPFEIKNGERIAQMVIAKHEVALFELVTEVTETARGEGGFGHTGK